MAATILGISLGTKLTGVAIIRDAELIDYRVKAFKQRWSKGKQQHILMSIGKLLEYYNVTHVSVKTPDPLRSSKQLNQLTKKLELFLQRRNVVVHMYSIVTAKLGMGIKAQNKNDFMYQIAERYSELRKKYLKEINNRHSYNEKMFEAIAVAKWLVIEGEL